MVPAGPRQWHCPGMPPSDFATVACLGLLLPVPVTLAWPIVLTAYPSPGGTSVLSNGLPGETRAWLHPDVLCTVSEPEFSPLLKEISEREGANKAVEVLSRVVLSSRGQRAVSGDICGCHDGGGGGKDAALYPQCPRQPHRE